MANKRLPMRKIRQVLRLRHACGFGEREITQSCLVVCLMVAEARVVTSGVITEMSPTFLSPAISSAVARHNWSYVAHPKDEVRSVKTSTWRHGRDRRESRLIMPEVFGQTCVPFR
jgi:hypothetical protein